MSRILGLDPATDCGWAWSDGPATKNGWDVRYGTWRLAPSGGGPDGLRLRNLLANIREVARNLGVDLIAYEQARLGSDHWNVQGFHAEMEGIIKLAAAELDVPVCPVNPTALKKFASQSGRATKGQMIRAAKTIYGLDVQDDNQADALFVMEFARHPSVVIRSQRPAKRGGIIKTGPKKVLDQGRLFR